MNRKPTLLILAAGMGSRYGGLKQIDSVGPSGETIMDYSIYDAIRAGFDKVVFIIRKDFEEAFREKIVAKYEGKIRIELAFQDPLDLPAGCVFPEGREKPWGTAHAIRSARNVIDAPFAAINADDFYGADAFRRLAKFLSEVDVSAQPKRFAMVGYRLDQTLSENGSVARGICDVAADGKLIGVTEMTKIARKADGSIQNEEDPAAPVPLKGENLVDINIGIGTLSILVDNDVIQYRFVPSNSLESNIKKTVVEGKNPLVEKAEKLLAKKIIDTYKDYFNG